MKVERVGVVGFGFAGQLHAQVLAERFPADKILVVDSSADKLTVAEEQGFTTFNNLPEFLKAEPELVITAIPPSINQSTIETIAVSDVKGVLIEKPIALTAKEAAMIDAILSQVGIFAMVGLTGHGFHPEFKAAKDVIESGALGTIHTFIEQIHQGGPTFPPLYTTHEYGGAIKELGIHTIDHMHYLLGRDDWENKFVTGGNDYWENTAPDWCETTLTSGEGNNEIVAHASWSFVKDYHYSQLTRSNYSTIIRGSRGSVIIYGFDGIEITTKSITQEIQFYKSNVSGRDRHLPGFRAEVNAFINAFENGDPSPVPLSYATKLQQTIDEIYNKVSPS